MRVLTFLASIVVVLAFSLPAVAADAKRCHWYVHDSVSHGHRHHHPNMSKREFRKLDHFHRAHHHHCHKVADTGSGNPPPPPDTTPPDTIRDASGYTEVGGWMYGFRATEPECTFECRDSMKPNWYACTSPVSFHAAPGPGWYEVRATDKAGNTDPTPVHRDFVQQP